MTFLAALLLCASARAAELAPTVDAWTPVLVRLGAAADPASPWARLASLGDLPEAARPLIVFPLAEALAGKTEAQLPAALETARSRAAAATAAGISRGVAAPGAEAAADWAAAVYRDPRFLELRSQAAAAAGDARSARVDALAMGVKEALVTPDEKQAVRRFLEERHDKLRRERPDLFLAKMKKAAESDFAFYRAFPDYYYKLLRASPEGARLAAAPKITVDGDLHAENVELVDRGKQRVLQPNDFDDTGKGPSTLDVARAMGSAALLSGSVDAAPSHLAALAAQAYAASLKQSFDAWVQSTQEERAVADAKEKDRDWLKNAGKPLADGALSRRLFALAGIAPASSWRLFDRIGAGLSSIGMLRYMFASADHAHAVEVKELRAAAIEFFTGRQPQGDAARVGRAYAELRQVPVEARTATDDGRDWMVRRREGKQRSLDFSHPKSAARLLGGLAAQLHRGQADHGALEEAASAVSVKLVLETLAAMARARAVLKALLAEGVWR